MTVTIKTSRNRDPVTYEQLLTCAEVAALWAVHTRTVVNWANQGRLRSVRTPAGHRRFFADEVHALAQNGRTR